MTKPFRYSSVSDYYKCPRYFKLKHVDGLDDGMGKSLDIYYGSCIHLGVQDLFEGGNGVDVFRTMFDLKTDLEKSRYGHDDLRKIGIDLLEIFQTEHMNKFKPTHLEHKMLIKLGKHDFSGVADFVGTYRDKLSIVDWKTAAYPYDQYKLIVNEQLYGYAHMVQETLGLKIEQVVYGVAVKDHQKPRWQFKAADLTQEVLDKKLANIELTCNTISETKEFAKNPSQCVVGKRVCAFFEECYGKGEKV
jgi:hypothetical protein